MAGIFDFVYTTLGLGRQRKQVPNTKHARQGTMGTEHDRLWHALCLLTKFVALSLAYIYVK